MKKNVFGLRGIQEQEEKTIKEKLISLIEADIPVFLHGQPGCGKSARVKELDPDCTTIELSLAPIEDLAGMDVESEGKVKKIMPQWLRDLEMKCEKEPFKKHILFLDELTNAPESVQTLAYSLVLERKVNHTWNLPKNVRIVLAGNEVEDSSVATEIVEPLKDRMAHLHIEDSISEWLDWAKEHKIHPAIMKYLEDHPCNLRTHYYDSENEEMRQVTPRTWERASRLLTASSNVSQLTSVMNDVMVYDFADYDSSLKEHGVEQNVEETIKTCLKADVPVFLQGRPGEGKSSRVKKIDPDCEILELSLLPVEDLSGMLVYEDGKLEKIKPAWLERLEIKCMVEPDKEHVLFLDELTNAVPRIQSLAYSLVLDKIVGNTWKLPKNVRVVAAGNSTQDSIAASDMPEPLIDRFAHVTVATSLEQWTKWAIENEIHPAIICFLHENENAFQTRANGDQTFTTPRTWERASNQLKKAHHVKALQPIIGEYLSKEFEDFCTESTISKEDILEGKKHWHTNTKPYRMLPGLLDASVEEVEIVRDYLVKQFPQTVSLFDELWIAHGEEREERKMMIEKLKEKTSDRKGDNEFQGYTLYDNGMVYQLDQWMTPMNPRQVRTNEINHAVRSKELGARIESDWDDLVGKYGKDAIIRSNRTQKSLRKSPGKYERIKKKYDSISR